MQDSFRTFSKLINSIAISKNLQNCIESEEYEKTEITHVLDTVDEDDIILELGAGIGALSTVVLSHRKPKEYVCVEANPHLVQLIKKNHSINGIDNCRVIAGVLGSSDGVRDFFICEDFWSSSLLEPNSYVSKIQVQSYSFAKLLEIYRPTYLVSDIEGGEFDLFTGTLDLSSVRKVCIELHTESDREAIGLYAFFVDRGLYLDNPPLHKLGVHCFSRR